MRSKMFRTRTGIVNEPWSIALLAACTWFLAIVMIVGITGCWQYARMSAHARALGPDRGADTVLVEASCAQIDPFERADADDPSRGVTEPISISAGYGSGVILDARHVLTALHVVDCHYDQAIVVTMSNGRRIRMHTEKIWRDSDLARLVIASAAKFGDIAPPMIAPIHLGESVCTDVAYPDRGGACGIVFDMRPSADLNVAMHLPVYHGNSGGGIYDTDGNLVGIVTASTFDTADPIGLGTMLYDLRDQVMP